MSSIPETLITTVWPTMAASPAGRLVGRLCASQLGYGFFTLGKLLALATIPLSLIAYFWRFMPVLCRRYAVTDRRVIVQKGLTAVEERSLGMAEFDAIEVVVRPGQEWLAAGDLVFRRDGQEILRMPGICRPEIVRRACLKTQATLLSFEQVRSHQAAEPQVA